MSTISCIPPKAEASKLHPQYKKKNMFPFKYAIDNFSLLTLLNCMILTEHQGARSLLVFWGFKKYIYGKWCHFSLLLPILQKKRKIPVGFFLYSFVNIEVFLLERIRSFGKWIIYHAPSFLPQEVRALGFASNCTVHNFLSCWSLFLVRKLFDWVKCSHEVEKWR